MTINTQTELDYIQAAHQRVAADTRVLKKRATLTLPAGSTTLTLPVEVVRLEAAYLGGDPMLPIPLSDYLQIVTSDTEGWSGELVVFVVVGRTLHTWPAPGADTAVTVFYSYRPAAITSNSTLEVTGQAERLVERLSGAYALWDDGQPELAQTELGAYLKDSARLRRQDRRSEGNSGRVTLVGRVSRR